MGNLLEYLTKFCGWPKCAAVILLSVLIVIPATFSTPIQTVDGIASPLLNKTRRPSWIRDLGENETLPGTLSLCPNVSDAKRFNETQGIRRYLDLRGLRGMNSTSFNVRPDFLMQLFRTFLELKESMSQHLVTLLINNRTVTELQNALTYAWLPSLENANWSATRAEILEIDNGTTYFSSNGSPLMQIRYTLPVSTIYSPANFSKGLPRYPWLYDRNSTNHELTQIVPPSVSDFIQRLQNKSLPVYDGPVFYTTSVLEHVYLAKNSTYGFFDTDQLKADMMEVAQQQRSSNFRREDTLIKWRPKSEKILDAVQQAFAIANPVIMDNITLTITLIERDDNFQTTTERDASRFSFALSYPEMKSGVYWKLWRYPSYDELNAALQSVADSKVAHTWTVAVPASDDLL
ncbi:uncharacterized protein LOC129589678 [Paramacrobiotus metropolitanus]|uniref:uncharacterized protein LOC129589678 n=1 Tax=Paramacrobiotus metropolitanus TaxID=2943436 RepID=UPI00244645EC|nr:uncharacterized protein LOC129589678 [Paramacrobiotus metropolitanus]